MKRSILTFVMAILAAFVFSSAAMAQSEYEGFELRGGINMPVSVTGAYVESVTVDKTITGYGSGLNLGAAYRFMSLLSAGIDVDANWNVYSEKNLYSNLSLHILAMLRAYFSIDSKMLLSAGLGVGTFIDPNVEKRRFSLKRAAFAFKVNANFVYFLSQNVGIGANVSYAYSFAPQDEHVTLFQHYITPGLAIVLTL